MSVVLTATDNHVTTVTLNRPDQMNAISAELRNTLTDTFIALRDDEDTRVIILTGAGRAFCAGLDLKELGQEGLGKDPHPVNLQDAVRSVGKPVIGAINGATVTGGFEIALMCDILVGSTEARFADTHVRMGVVPGWGLSQRLAQLVGASRAKQLSFTGNYLTAETAERWGLVNDVVAPEELLPHCRRIADDIVSVDQPTLRAVHTLINLGQDRTIEEGLAAEHTLGAAHKRQSPVELEQRRLDVQTRGRNQLT